MADWSFQTSVIEDATRALEQWKRVIVCSPTGSGKTRCMMEIITPYVMRGDLVIIYSNRKELASQLSRVFRREEFDVGMIAAGQVGDHRRNLQICMIQTVSRRKDLWDKVLKHAACVVVDEAHMNTGGQAEKLIRFHASHGAHILGLSATPVNLRGLYFHMVKGPSPAELEQRRVVVPIHYYAPAEIDMTGVAVQQKKNNREFVREAVSERIQSYGRVIIGDIIETMEKLNPFRLPTVCFAPSVPTSAWLCDHFRRCGYTAEHIDAKTPNEVRKDIFERWRGGDLQIVSNFGILREAFDFQGLYYGILLQPCNSIQTAVQIVGRVRRSYPGKTHAVIADHVGNWWRNPGYTYYHDWELGEESEDAKEKMIYGDEDTKEPPPPQPINCWQCGRVWTPGKEGSRCPGCGYEKVVKGRKIRPRKGDLKWVDQDINKLRGGRDDKKMVRAIFVAQKQGLSANGAVTLAMRMVKGRSLDVSPKYRTPSNGNVSCRQAWPWLFNNKKKELV